MLVKGKTGVDKLPFPPSCVDQITEDDIATLQGLFQLDSDRRYYFWGMVFCNANIGVIADPKATPAEMVSQVERIGSYGVSKPLLFLIMMEARVLYGLCGLSAQESKRLGFTASEDSKEVKEDFRKLMRSISRFEKILDWLRKKDSLLCSRRLLQNLETLAEAVAVFKARTRSEFEATSTGLRGWARAERVTMDHSIYPIFEYVKELIGKGLASSRGPGLEAERLFDHWTHRGTSSSAVKVAIEGAEMTFGQLPRLIV